MKNGISYFGLKLLILLSHAMLLGIVFLKGNYESLSDPILLSVVVLGSDLIYFGILRGMHQAAYTVDFVLVLLLGMSVLFQSCFGSVGFAAKHFLMCAAAFAACQVSYLLTRNPAAVEQKKPLLYLLFGVLVAVIFFCTGSRGIWVDLGFITVQPSEFVKPVFVLICATSVSRQMDKRRLLRVHYVPDNLLVYGCTLCIAALQWWCRDLGSLPTFLAIALCGLICRLCYPKAKLSKRLVISLCGIGVIGVVCALLFAPDYVQQRLHADIWSDPKGSGYQQCRALIGIAEGGWFGKGPGCGSLYSVAASDTDTVFATISEEWGLMTALLAVCMNVLLLATAIMHAPRTYYHSTMVNGVAAVFTVQMALNIFGSCNLIPFTGVTIPFLSQGGSSMLSSGILIGFLKAAQSPILKRYETELPEGGESE